MPLPSNQADNIERFFTAIKSLNELDKMEIRNVVGGMLAPTVRESQFTLNYQRAAINIEFLLETMKNTKQFQAINAVARSTLETAVELKLMAQDPDCARKVALFTELEKLKAAKKVASYKARHPDANVATRPYEQFIAANEERILREKDQIWPKHKSVNHWSLMNMEARCRHLGGEFEKHYDLHYSQLSWYIHSGVTGVSNVQGETLALLCGTAFSLAMECYASILDSIVHEFRIYNADPTLKDKITYAKMLPWTQTQEERHRLAQAFGLR